MKYRKMHMATQRGYGFTTIRLVVLYRHVYQDGRAESIGMGYSVDDMRFSTMNGRRRNVKRDTTDDYKDWGRTFMEAMWCRWDTNEDK